MEELYTAINEENYDDIINECNILLYEPEHKLKGKSKIKRKANINQKKCSTLIKM